LFSKQIKGKKAWIPNQVGDDIGVFFGDDKVLGSPIKDFGDDSMVVFEDDSGCAFEDDRSVFIQVTYFCHSGELFVIPAKAGIQEVFVLKTNKRKESMDPQSSWE